MSDFHNQPIATPMNLQPYRVRTREVGNSLVKKTTYAKVRGKKR